jgi:hypothetical protein
MVPDPDMLQAAQLLLPGDYQATGAVPPNIAKQTQLMVPCNHFNMILLA